MKAPELKTPDIKPPKFLSDLYRDLREQRLLPLVALLLIAIPVVPFVLSNPTPAFVPPAEGEGLVPPGDLAGDSLFVVADQPGLRDHTHRFGDRSPRNPFKSTTTPVPSAPEGETGGGSGTEIAAVTAGSGRGTEIDLLPEPGGRGGGGGEVTIVETEPQITFFRVRASVRFGKAGSGVLRSIPDLPRLSGLPNSQPVVIYIGASDDGKRAIFSVSSDVVKVSGKGQCSSGRPTDCQYLTMKPGRAANLHDARRGVTWRLALTSIDLVETEMQPTEMPPQRRPQGPPPGQVPVEEPSDGSGNPDKPVSSQAASLSEVIGLYLLK